MERGGLKQAEDYALSDDDIRKLLGGGIKITPYSDLENCSNINQLFDSRGRAILFFPQESEREGHWCCMIRDGREIEFFDPYGKEPDAQKKGIPPSKLEQLHMDHPDLTRLLLQSGCRVIYNKVALQKLSNSVQTCGRHCVCRLLYYKYPIQRYREIIKRSGLSPDEFSVEITFNELGK
jgi:hypothetical protein